MITLAHEKEIENVNLLLAALQVLLDQVDYTASNCRVNEMVGAVLPKEVIKQGRDAIAAVLPPK